MVAPCGKRNAARRETTNGRAAVPEFEHFSNAAKRRYVCGKAKHFRSDTYRGTDVYTLTNAPRMLFILQYSYLYVFLFVLCSQNLRTDLRHETSDPHVPPWCLGRWLQVSRTAIECVGTSGRQSQALAKCPGNTERYAIFSS